MNMFKQEDFLLGMNVIHLLVVIPLIYLAINPRMIPMSIPTNVVIYAVYALLAVGVLFHGYKVVAEIVKRRQPSVQNEDTEAAPLVV